MRIVLNLTELKKAVVARLEYIAGKRATTGEEYWRHAACEADAEMMARLTEDAMADVALRLGRWWKGYSIGGDMLAVTFAGAETGDEGEAGIALRTLLTEMVIAGWLRLTGLETHRDYADDVEAMVERLARSIGRRPGLRSRCLITI